MTAVCYSYYLAVRELFQYVLFIFPVFCILAL